MTASTLAELLNRYPTRRCYALVDAARARAVYQVLCQLPSDACSCLFEGAPDLAAHAPYLVLLDARTWPHISALWGRECVVFLWSARELAEVRRHFRRFLMVRVAKHQVYFRFYDPRVLRVFLSNCSDAERQQFWGDVSAFVAELPGAEGARLFERGSDGALLRTTVALIDSPDAIVSS